MGLNKKYIGLENNGFKAIWKISPTYTNTKQ